MHLSTLLAICLPIFGIWAVPIDDCSSEPSLLVTTTTVPVTATTTNTITLSTSITNTTIAATSTTNTFTSTTDTSSPTTNTSTSSTTTSTSANATPTLPYTVISARSGSPIHLLPLNAAGLNFYLGGLPATYCPLTDTSLCPPGDVTAFIGSGALDSEVPGGQIIFVAPDGHLGFSQAHSAQYPFGSSLAPFNYSQAAGTQFGHITTNAFGATGFMACPQTSDATTSLWQVFASLANATIPTGNTSDCLGFDVLASDYNEGTVAAWQYT